MFNAAGSSLSALQVSLSELITGLPSRRWNTFVLQMEDQRHFTELKRFVGNSGSSPLYSQTSYVSVMWHVLERETVELFASGLARALWTVPQGDSSENSWVEKHVGYIHKVGVFDEARVHGPDRHILNPGLNSIKLASEKDLKAKRKTECLRSFRITGP